MENTKLNLIIENFLVRFNKMCEVERKDFLLRERLVEYEYSSKIKQFKVSYRLKRSNNEWLLEAVSWGFWIFRRKYPLLRIKRNGNTINFSGMFTYTIAEFNVELIENKLSEYLEICKKQRRNVFIKS